MLLSALLSALLLVQAPAFAPERFFVGRTVGHGTVRMILGGRHGFSVQSRGRIAPDGALLLDQVVQEEGKPARRRSWRLARNGPGQFTGTLSDARGPVTGEVSGNVLHISYRARDRVAVEQWITLQPGGRSAHNRMTFRRFGLTVATVEETIRRVD